MQCVNREQIILSIVAAGELEIDSQGRIWRVAKMGGRPDRGAFATRPCPRVRGEYPDRSGYLLVTTTIRGVKTVTSAHRLVWTQLHGPIPDGLTINHRNGVKGDNRPENLELATYSEQRRHAIDVLNVNRNRPTGIKHPKTHLTESDVCQIRQLRAAGAMAKDLAVRFGLGAQAVSAICLRRTWTHI